jgi:release factor glutamine methyltransferase
VTTVDQHFEFSHADVAAELRAAGCVFAEDEAALLCAEARGAPQLSDMVSRRVAGTPLEHIVGWAEFCGLRIAVTEGVFVPRPRTQFLARLAATLLGPGGVLVDLCCGSAAIGAAVAAASGSIELHAVDIDETAVRCARRNLTSGNVYRGDLFAPLPHHLRGRVNVITANTPYVPSRHIEQLPREARDHEPRFTVDGGDDGLGTLRRVTAQASEWLAPNGHLLLEVSARQADAAVQAVAAGGLVPHICRSEEFEAIAAVGVRQ